MFKFESFPRITPAAARVNAGMSQDVACKKIGISKASLQNYEKGKTMPPWDVVQRMEDVYGFPAAYIVFPSNTVKTESDEVNAG